MANRLTVIQSTAQRSLSTLEAGIAEVVKFSSEALMKLQQGTLTPEDLHQFNWALDNFLMHKHMSRLAEPAARKSAPPRQVFFNYNGESFEAYEILGIPDTITVDFARAHFEKKYASGPSGDTVIYKLALEALESAGS